MLRSVTFQPQGYQKIRFIMFAMSPRPATLKRYAWGTKFIIHWLSADGPFCSFSKN
jgi:hypothetical protein